MNYTKQINTYLKNQNKKQRTYLYISVFILIMVLGYIFYLSDIEQEFEDSTYRLDDKKIEHSKVQNSAGVKKIKVLKKQIKDLELKIKNKELESSSSDIYTSASKNLNVTDGSFTQFLEEFMSYAKDLHVKLQYVKINREKLPYIGLIEIKKSLSVKGTGKFLNVLKLIREMESRKFLIKLKYLTINKSKHYKNKDVDFKFSLEILGAAS